MKAEMMTNEPFCPTPALRKKHGLDEQVVARAQALSRRMIAGNAGAPVEDFLADRASEAARR